MSDFFGKLKTGANKVAFEADKLARVNRTQGEAEKLKSQIHSQTTKLGEMIYQKFSNQEAIDPAFMDICQAIAQLHQQVNTKNDEISRIKAETFGAPPAAPAPAPAPTPTEPESAPANPEPEAAPEPQAKPAPMYCPNCGEDVEPGEKFCKDCGQKL